jgi:hypothetical protein
MQATTQDPKTVTSSIDWSVTNTHQAIFVLQNRIADQIPVICKIFIIGVLHKPLKRSACLG